MSQAGALENIHHNIHRIGTENGTIKASDDTQNTSKMEVAMEAKTSSEKAKFCIENRQLPAFGLGRGRVPKNGDKNEYFFYRTATPCKCHGETYLFLTTHDQIWAGSCRSSSREVLILYRCKFANRNSRSDGRVACGPRFRNLGEPTPSHYNACR